MTTMRTNDLTNMLANTVKDTSDWDKRLSHVLYVYRTSPQESTKESPFFLLYGRDGFHVGDHVP